MAGVRRWVDMDSWNERRVEGVSLEGREGWSPKGGHCLEANGRLVACRMVMKGGMRDQTKCVNFCGRSPEKAIYDERKIDIGDVM
jgi:hypothetical protein